MTPQQIEALKLALEALEDYKYAEARTIIREALAQPEQEPVAMVESVATVVSESGNKEITMSWWHEPALPVGTKLYTLPPQRKPLTQDGTMEIANQTAGQYWMDEAHIQRFRAAVEAAHGIKENT